MTDTPIAPPAWVRARHARLSTTPLGVLGAGWVLYALGVLGAVYGYLFLPARGWGLLQVSAAIVVMLGGLIAAAELIARSAHRELTAALAALPFQVRGYPEALGDAGAERGRVNIAFAAELPPAETIAAAVDDLGSDWVRVDQNGDNLSLYIEGGGEGGTNWLFAKRVRAVLNQVCATLHERTAIATVEIALMRPPGDNTTTSRKVTE